jgi:hypothetical protein
MEVKVKETSFLREDVFTEVRCVMDIRKMLLR